MELFWAKPHSVQRRDLDLLHLGSRKWNLGIRVLSWVQPGLTATSPELHLPRPSQEADIPSNLGVDEGRKGPGLTGPLDKTHVVIPTNK